ncbi:MAG: hypothetical protein KKI06_10865, partial [Euryarchaeota archaeon]|nr:hypothetical protein [Euryarchaeota archaeon]
SGMLPICQKHFRIISGEKIAEELKEISLEDDDLGKAAKEALNYIEIVSAGKKFDIGEDEALELLEKMGADILISDDIRFVKKHRNNEKISFSVLLLGILMERKNISKIQFLNAVNVMFGKRKWEENLIYLVAKNMLEED